MYDSVYFQLRKTNENGLCTHGQSDKSGYEKAYCVYHPSVHKRANKRSLPKSKTPSPCVK